MELEGRGHGRGRGEWSMECIWAEANCSVKQIEAPQRVRFPLTCPSPRQKPDTVVIFCNRTGLLVRVGFRETEESWHTFSFPRHLGKAPSDLLEVTSQEGVPRPDRILGLN